MSFWIEHIQRPFPVSAPLPSECNVCIIGAGITGCSLAYYLGQRGVVDVLLLEARDSIAMGATGRNGGHLHANASCQPIPSIAAFDQHTVSLVREFFKWHPGRASECDMFTTGAMEFGKGGEDRQGYTGCRGLDARRAGC